MCEKLCEIALPGSVTTDGVGCCSSHLLELPCSRRHQAAPRKRCARREGAARGAAKNYETLHFNIFLIKTKRFGNVGSGGLPPQRRPMRHDQVHGPRHVTLPGHVTAKGAGNRKVATAPLVCRARRSAFAPRKSGPFPKRCVLIAAPRAPFKTSQGAAGRPRRLACAASPACAMTSIITQQYINRD